MIELRPNPCNDLPLETHNSYTQDDEDDDEDDDEELSESESEELEDDEPLFFFFFFLVFSSFAFFAAGSVGLGSSANRVLSSSRVESSPVRVHRNIDIYR